jgi:CHAT domain-containing protein
MRQYGWAFLLIVLSVVWGAWPAASHAADLDDFGLGKNTEAEDCRAVTRFDPPPGGASADIYCGAWENPSGRVTLYPSRAAAEAAHAQACQGAATQLQSADFTSLTQIACTRTDQTGPVRYVLIARRGDAIVVGDVFPSDWTPLVSAARVLAGIEPAAAATAAGGETPGLREIEAVFPGGAPGQAAAHNYELMLRRAYEYNSIWSFDTAERDFEELLTAHNRIAPDDTSGEAEIYAEIGLNMSNARRFDEANDAFAKATSLLVLPKDALLASKILNYRALDQLNHRQYAAALRLALQANQARTDIARAAREAAPATITAGDVGRVERTNVDAPGQRGILISLSEAPSTDRATILTAQGYYIAAIAARGSGRPDEAGFLAAASNTLDQVVIPPIWLVEDIANEEADSRLAAGDAAGADAAAEAGLKLIKTSAPGTRAEAHLWLTLEGAETAEGRVDDALASGRQAMAIFARQSESPGMPADIAAPHLALLAQQYQRTGDAKLAAEYFQTMTLVWDSAAARTTAQMAARMVLGQAAGDQARDYQDAQRAYRAALARRQLLAQTANPSPALMSAADTAVQDASKHLVDTEAALRAKAPAYLELLSPLASSDDLQAVLGDHEAYLRIAIGTRGGFGVLVDKAGPHPFLVPLTSAQADAYADGIRRSTRLRGHLLPDFDLDASRALYTALIGPVEGLLANVQDLDVDVSGSLASVPLAALVATAPDPATLAHIHDNQDYSGVDWLARRFAISNTLGPASFIRLRKASPPPSGALHATLYGDYQRDPQVVADRVGAANNLSDGCRAQIAHALLLMGPLPETADEARSVAADFPGGRLVLGDGFTDVDFLTSPDTANADVIMVATHGVLALSSCFPEPALLTSVGPTGDGLIGASQLLDRQLKAQLVVLSACDTAAGGKLDEAVTGLGDGGDALSGLARGFIYAGARNVLATEWKVDAASSSAEMGDFLAAASQPGVNLGQALAASQRKLFGQAETAHPFYWAAFVLVGDGGRVLHN